MFHMTLHDHAAYLLTCRHVSQSLLRMLDYAKSYNIDSYENF